MVRITKGKWAQGIRPRHFAWIIKDRLAICERPGGYGSNHRRVRRQEEIIWIREQGFAHVVSLISSTHNLHNYDELGVKWLHRPFGPYDQVNDYIRVLYPELRDRLGAGEKLILHGEEVNDRLIGLMAGYIRWVGLVPAGPQAITIIEQITERQMGPTGRGIVATAGEMAGLE